MRIKIVQSKGKANLDFDLNYLLHPQAPNTLKMITDVPIFETVELFRCVGEFQGETFWEGDWVETSDGKLKKKLEWVDSDYGFSAMWSLARYAEKTGCRLIKIKGE